jgi:hypothetical protein
MSEARVELSITVSTGLLSFMSILTGIVVFSHHFLIPDVPNLVRSLMFLTDSVVSLVVTILLLMSPKYGRNMELLFSMFAVFYFWVSLSLYLN